MSNEINKGKSMPSVTIFFISAFVLAVAGLIVYMKSDDVAYKKAVSDLADIRGELKTDAKEIQTNLVKLSEELATLQTTCVTKLNTLEDSLNKQENIVRALDLEVLRVKEKMNKMQVRAVPTTHTIKFEPIAPIPIQVIGGNKKPKASLLERAGIKEKPKRH